jgi:hypothetical protein
MPQTSRTLPTGARLLFAGAAALLAGACSTMSVAQSQPVQVPELSAAQAPTYADLVSMALASDTVAIVAVEDQIPFPPERAPNVPPSQVRLYVEALTQNLLKAPNGVGATMVFVVDQQRLADGNAPDLEERLFLLFGDLSTTQPGALQLLSSNAMVPHGPRIEERVRRVLTQLAAADAPPAITGVRDVISVPGNLAGESETQMFVETATGAPVSLTVIRRPGMRPEWGVSLGELVDASARPPEPETIAWYHFACFLPRELPADSFLQRDRASQDQARADYAFILGEMGPCERRFT